MQKWRREFDYTLIIYKRIQFKKRRLKFDFAKKFRRRTKTKKKNWKKKKIAQKLWKKKR